MKILSNNEMSVVTAGKSKKCAFCGKKYKTKFTYTYHGIWNFSSQCLVEVKLNPW